MSPRVFRIAARKASFFKRLLDFLCFLERLRLRHRSFLREPEPPTRSFRASAILSPFSPCWRNALHRILQRLHRGAEPALIPKDQADLTRYHCAMRLRSPDLAA